ncbi:MAG: hypothetical protein IKZ87_01325 [Actinomycetaceae bacterium]|nr:hypothetical protein [Actinomycetaceae bacterium]
MGKPEVQGVLGGKVEITEKVDGSQIGFGIIDGELVIRSREQRINPECPPELFENASKHIVSIVERLMPGAFYYGEAVQKHRHNKLSYDRVPRGHIVLFGAMYPTIGADGKETLMFLREHKDLEVIAGNLGVDVAPLLFSGVGCTEGFLETLLEHESFLGGCKIEGVVVKDYGDGSRDDVKVAKLVSAKFKECNKPKSQKKQTSAVEKTEELFAGYATSARWDKALQHLSERGQLKGDMSDIGRLIKEVNIDTLEEEEAAIKDALWGIWRKEFLRKLTGGLANWYEQRLRNGGYTDEEAAEMQAQYERDMRNEELRREELGE